MEIYLFDYNVREGLSETQAVAWVANKQTHAKPFQRLLPVEWCFG
jgi:hypothetical protein